MEPHGYCYHCNFRLFQYTHKVCHFNLRPTVKFTNAQNDDVSRNSCGNRLHYKKQQFGLAWLWYRACVQSTLTR